MNIRIRVIIYFFSTSLAALGAGVSDELTTAGWIRLIVLSLAAGCAAVVAYLDRSSGEPPLSTGSAKTVVAVVAIALALALSGCITVDTSFRLPSGTRIRAGTNGTGGSIEVSREF